HAFSGQGVQRTIPAINLQSLIAFSFRWIPPWPSAKRYSIIEGKLKGKQRDLLTF
uniref:Uncharacterized protein n=1 Tax=Panagrolaimus sp. PS1159 TaxID=55785 RepID=A0AC35FAT3_9BILA